MLKASGSTEAASIKMGILFSRAGISPNMWTVLALVPAALGFLALVYNELLLSLALFLVSGLIDAIDGAVARVTGSVSNLGAFLDGIIDRYVEFLLYAGLLVYLTTNYAPELLFPHMYWIILLVFGALMPTFIRAYADHRNVVTEPEDHKRMGGLVERAERLSLLFAGMILGLFNISFLVYMVAATSILSHITAFQRIRFVLKK
jgi:archaetidylinositol phosphate synthase